MTQGYDARGRRVGATIIEVSPNFVTQVKTKEGKDGYNAIQIGTGFKKSVRKPQKDHFKKMGVSENTRWLKESRIKNQELSNLEELKPGLQITASQVFSKGDVVKVTGVSKGKGFAGVVKRHHFAGGPKTHGQSDRHRAPGSIGQGTTPGRVYKGKRMAGHMGVETVSVKNLEVLTVDKTANLITLKGAVPGPAGAMVTLTRLGRVKGYTPPPEEKPDEEELEASIEKQELSEEAVIPSEVEGSADEKESGQNDNTEEVKENANN